MPTRSVMDLGSSWSLQQWNTQFTIYEGFIPANFRSYTYVDNNFDSWSGLFGAGDRNILLSEYSDLVLLGSGDDRIIVKNDVWTPWGGDDVILGGSGLDKLLFMSGTRANYIFTSGSDANGSFINISSASLRGSIKTYSIEQFHGCKTKVY